mgnify:FL=1
MSRKTINAEKNYLKYKLLHICQNIIGVGNSVNSKEIASI